MTGVQANVVVRHIRDLAAAGDARQAPDRDLLERFAARGDEAAFAALVRRHGPLVLGVCRRVLHHEQDAEDAFQAAFLLLARRAGSVGRAGSLGGWLYRVAHRLALKARARAANPRRAESVSDRSDTPDPLAEVTGRELLAALDEELARLPPDERSALALCYLEGRTGEEAARELGWSVRTLKRRLHAGRGRLRERLGRRGLTLPAALLALGVAPAALPAALTASTAGAAARTAAVRAPVADLLRDALGTGTPGKTKVVGALLLALGLAAAGARLSAGGAPGAEGTRPADPPAAAAPKAGRAPAAPDARQAVVTGRVVDAGGRPVPGAALALLATSCLPEEGKYLRTASLGVPGEPDDLLARAKADAEGNFRCTFPRPRQRGDQPPVATLVGLAPGHALGWESVPLKEGRAEVVLRLPAEEPVRGRLVDLQGQPAAGARVYLVQATQDAAGQFSGVRLQEEVGDAPFWPAPAVSDERGYFTLRGVSRGMALTARVRDDRFALTDVRWEPGGKEAAVALGPARVIAGRVIKADTREPAAGVVVRLSAYPNNSVHLPLLVARTDKDGRFRVNHYAADRYDVRTDDCEGRPYFAINFIDFTWPRGARLEHTLEVALPRGILQGGKVVDAAGKPVADAHVLYLPQLDNNPFLKGQNTLALWERQIGRARTHADGSFHIPVLPGPGHLAVDARGGEYTHQVRTRHEIFGHDRLAGFWTANAFVKLDVRPGAAPADVTARLQNARTFHGKLVDAAGKPVAAARLAVRTLDADLHRESGIAEEHEDRGIRTGPTIAVKDGRFTLPGCDPTARYRVFVLDEANRRAATTLMEGTHPEDAPLTVRWQECGSASARFVDAGGKPAGRYALLWVAEALPDRGGTMRTAAPFADVVVTDREGKIVLDRLVPGVRYLLLQPDGKEVKEFTAGPPRGKHDLGDLVIDPNK
jgi:RNA polymerase sigma factor (sigma-70 family)